MRSVASVAALTLVSSGKTCLLHLLITFAVLSLFYHISAFCHQYETKGLFYIVTFLLCVSSTFFLRMSSLKALKHLIP